MSEKEKPKTVSEDIAEAPRARKDTAEPSLDGKMDYSKIVFPVEKTEDSRILEEKPDEEPLEKIRQHFTAEEEMISYGNEMVRKSVAECLMYAEKLANAEGYEIVLADGYRTLAAGERNWQNALHKYGSPEIADDYVARPGGSHHHTGGAVDVLLKKDGKLLMRVSSDYHKAHLNDPEYQDATTRLARYMGRAGFVRLTTESWHFEIGSKGWQKLVGQYIDADVGYNSTDEHFEKIEKENPPGELHDTYETEIRELNTQSPEIRQHNQQTLAATDIGEIRGSSRLLTPKEGEESNEEIIENVKEETRRRINVYTSARDGEWYTLDYKSVASTHEYGIGLGNILLDPDVKQIMVRKKNGSVVLGTRGTVAEGKAHEGRLGFVDKNGDYIRTYTGDQFRILHTAHRDTNNLPQEVAMDDPKDIDRYIREYTQEEENREKEKAAYQRQGKLLSSRTLNYGDNLGEALKAQDAQPITENEIVKRLDREGHNGQDIVQYAKGACEKFEIPWEIYKELIRVESQWSPKARYLGPIHSHASGLGQFQPGTWSSFVDYCEKNKIHDARWGEPPLTQESRFNPYAILYATAWLMRQTKDQLKAEIEGQPLHIQGTIYYLAHHEGLAGAKNFLSEMKKGNVPKADILALAKKVGLRALASHPEKIEEALNHEKGQWVEENLEYPGQTYKEPAIKIKVKGGQDTWILGSSTAKAMSDKASDTIGVCGIVGAGPARFLEHFKSIIWPKISHLTLPKEVVLVGMAYNDDQNEQAKYEKYKEIARFFEAKGVHVRFATIQPGDNPDRSKRFNDFLRTQQEYEVVDLARRISDANGNWLPGMARENDNVHLSDQAEKILIEELTKKTREKNPDQMSENNNTQNFRNALNTFSGKYILDQFSGNGGRDTAILIPQNFDPQKPTEIRYHFHGTGSEIVTEVGLNRLEQTLTATEELAQSKNVIVIYPLSGPPTGERKSHYDWMDTAKGPANGDVTQLHREVLGALQKNFGSTPQITKVSASGNSSGGNALRNIAENLAQSKGGVKIDEYIFLDASYGKQEESSKNWAARAQAAQPDAQFLIMLQKNERRDSAYTAYATVEPEITKNTVIKKGNTSIHVTSTPHAEMIKTHFKGA